jgi:hypothetical protein
MKGQQKYVTKGVLMKILGLGATGVSGDGQDLRFANRRLRDGS